MQRNNFLYEPYCKPTAFLELPLLSHDNIWAALDALASDNNLTPSGLARQAGLDPTSFNKSKRTTGEGRLRWPSTESISKALRATGTNLSDFLNLVDGQSAQLAQLAENFSKPQRTIVPLLGFAEAGDGGFFDDGGFPQGQGWDEVEFPTSEHEQIYALEVSGNSMLPLYRDGDTIIVAPGANFRKGDRVVAKTTDGEVLVKLLTRQTASGVELKSLNPEHEDRSIPAKKLDWIARVIWASQ